VTVPIYALNQVSEERCEWLVPGMLQDKVLALCKSLHQRPRSRLVPLPDYAAEFCHRALRPGQPAGRAAEGRARAHAAGGAAQRLQARAAAPHLFMNFRVVDEHGRQLAPGATWRR
jgi:ATP-dependent helicase HrpA